MKEDKGMPFFDAVKLQCRAMKDEHRLDPQLFLSGALEKIVSAAAPFVMVFLLARILDELAGERRSDKIWIWVTSTVFISGVLALVRVVLARWKSVHIELYRIRYQALFMDKQFEMDFADIDKQSTCDLRAQIQQNEGWMNWGFGYAAGLFFQIVESVTGMISAVVLTASLFYAKVPDSAGNLRVLNSPVFLAALLGVMVFLSVVSSKLQGRAQALEVSLVSMARLGNRLFGYFGFFGFFGEDKRDIDIRMYNQDPIVAHYFAKSLEQTFGTKGPFARLAKGRGGIYHGVAASLSTVFTGAVYVFTCLKALAGAFGVGAVTQYVGAATSLSGSMSQLFSTLETMRSNGKFLALCYEYLDLPNAMYQGSLTTEKRSDREYHIEFRDVSFRYPGADTWALRHVNVTFGIGSRMAVVGENGSGKTTFIKLLCRLYDPQEGEILLNGIDIKKYDYRDYMDLFSIVFQDFQLLSQPLADNVACSHEYDTARVVKALHDAGLEERVKSMTGGLNTQLYRQYDDNGVEVSGGEAQKIAIARALYRNAPFLILDEPTAALDPVAEAEIYARLNQIVEDRTAIYISHRLSSCRFCDEILVFECGQIIQRGPHDELVRQKGGKYYALWHAQAQYYAAND